MSSSAIVQKLWNYCNLPRFAWRRPARRPVCVRSRTGRRDGYGDYPSARLRAGVEQLTYVLFLKMADERTTFSITVREL
jgi:hypothetical protein